MAKRTLVVSPVHPKFQKEDIDGLLDGSILVRGGNSNGPLRPYKLSTEQRALFDQACSRGWLELVGKCEPLENAWRAWCEAWDHPCILTRRGKTLTEVYMDLVSFPNSTVVAKAIEAPIQAQLEPHSRRAHSYWGCLTKVFVHPEVAAGLAQFVLETVKIEVKRQSHLQQIEEDGSKARLGSGLLERRDPPVDRQWRVTCFRCSERLNLLIFERKKAETYILRVGWVPYIDTGTGVNPPSPVRWFCPACNTNRVSRSVGRPVTLERPSQKIVDVTSDALRRAEAKRENSMRPFVRLYKDGDHMAVQTNCDSEAVFTEHLCGAFAHLIDSGKYAHDWEFQLRCWLPQAFEILAKLRGYKSDVHEERVITAGPTSVSSLDVVIDSAESVGDNGRVPEEVAVPFEVGSSDEA